MAAVLEGVGGGLKREHMSMGVDRLGWGGAAWSPGTCEGRAWCQPLRATTKWEQIIVRGRVVQIRSRPCIELVVDSGVAEAEVGVAVAEDVAGDDQNVALDGFFGRTRWPSLFRCRGLWGRRRRRAGRLSSKSLFETSGRRGRVFFW